MTNQVEKAKNNQFGNGVIKMENGYLLTDENPVVKKVRERSVLNRNFGRRVENPFKDSVLTDDQLAGHGVDREDDYIGIESLMASGGYVDEEGKRWIMHPFAKTYHSTPHTKEYEEKLMKEMEEHEKHMAELIAEYDWK